MASGHAATGAAGGAAGQRIAKCGARGIASDDGSSAGTTAAAAVCGVDLDAGTGALTAAAARAARLAVGADQRISRTQFLHAGRRSARAGASAAVHRCQRRFIAVVSCHGVAVWTFIAWRAT